MCGRFSLAIDSEDLQTAFSLGQMPPEWRPRYNITPTQQIAVVPDASTRNVVMMRWGLVPFWAKDPSIGGRMINARAETVAEKPSFKNSLKHKRCLILADGFYEWQRSEPGAKAAQPYYFSLKNGQPFAFAGLWDDWQPKGLSSEPGLTTCTIITTQANEAVAPVHDRMPVILTGQAMWDWLLAEQELQVLSLLQPLAADLMRSWPISRQVNDPANDSAEIIKPLENLV